MYRMYRPTLILLLYFYTIILETLDCNYYYRRINSSGNCRQTEARRYSYNHISELGSGEKRTSDL